jgi:rare lipoprotein A
MEFKLMRKILMSLFAVATLGVFGAPSAQAASSWACEGPEYVCGSSNRSVAREARETTVERKAKRTVRAAAERNDDQPAKATKRRNKQVASRAVEADDKPARRKQRTARSYDNDGGGSVLTGKASYYWQPQALASGGRFNPNAMTAAHKTLPFGTRVRVTNQNNGQSVDVVINDRGPYIAGRIIDLSKAAAGSINMQNSGVVPVSVRVLGRG